MRATHAFLIISVILTAAVAASGCGDKLLHLSRIHRKHVRPGETVVIFSRHGSLLENASSLHMEKSFREEGYNLLLVRYYPDLALAIKAHAADLVIADFLDASSIEQMAGSSPVLIVPVVNKGDRSTARQASRYAAVIKSPAKVGKFLDAVDRALESKLARQNQHAKLRPVSAGN